MSRKRYLTKTAILLSTLMLGSKASVGATSVVFTQTNLNSILEQSKKLPARATQLPREHPEYPVMIVLQALELDRSGKVAAVVQKLEPLLPQLKYEGISTHKKKTAKLYFDTIGSFELWRNLAYVLLGRSYYELGKLNEAVHYLSAVTNDSPFAAMAGIEKGWALARLKSEQADSHINDLSGLVENSNAEQRSEARLVLAFQRLQKEDYEDAASLASPLSFTNSRMLAALRLKILAEARFASYLKDFKSFDFREKRSKLEPITKYLSKIPSAERDSDLSFMAAEVYWHLASAYRIEDPVKSRKTWVGYLNDADGWLSPWIKKSKSAGKPLLNEDAFFLSVAILWEQDRTQEAIPRLLLVPKFFPKGEYHPDVYQLLADHYFDEGRFDSALKYYSLLSRTQNPEKAAYGVYKAAWSFYNKQEKWAALRHLERLLMYYRSEIPDGAPVPPGSLVTEVENDMLLVMAEQLSHQKALKEIEIFKFSQDKRDKVIDRLGRSYKGIGKFEDAVAIWKILLRKPSDSDQAFEWMHMMLKALLASGDRREMAKALNEFIPKLPENQEKNAELQKWIVSLLLTVHREARKTDDRNIWAATDELYTAFISNFPNSQEGHIWYYGAQRKEGLNKKWDAIAWYQKAGEIKNYKNRLDSGISVLRILKETIDSKKSKGQKLDYQKITEATGWYVQEFPNTKQRTLAEFIYIEAAFKSGRLKEAKDYLVRIFKREGATKEHQEQLLAHNNRLYKKKEWQEAYFLADQVIKALGSRSPDFRKKLARFRQETAFQTAFQFEKKDPNRAREWYDRAIQSHYSESITLKAWYNLLQTYKFPADTAVFTKKVAEFDVSYEASGKLNSEQRGLLRSIYGRTQAAWEQLGQPLKKAITLSKAVEYEPKKEARLQMRWDAALIYGSYYVLESMEDELRSIKKISPKFLETDQNQLTIARVYFWNAKYKKSWKKLKRLLTRTSRPTATMWILLGDLYRETFVAGSSAFEPVKKYLLRNQKRLKGVNVLAPLWARIIDADFEPGNLTKWKGKRSIASYKTDGSSVQQLKGRLKGVSSTLNEHRLGHAELEQYLKSGAPQVIQAALCAAPKITGEAVRRLQSLRVPRIKSKQWPQFVKKLNQKIVQLKKRKKREDGSCNDQKNQLPFMPPLKAASSPLCSKTRCFPAEPDGASQVIGIVRKWAEKRMAGENPQKLEMVKDYLEEGAWATAELLAYSADTVAERSLLLGYIRLAMGDPWNAAPLFTVAKKKKKYESHSKLFLSRTAWRHRYRSVASKESKGIKRPDLLPWAQGLYNEMSSDLGR